VAGPLAVGGLLGAAGLLAVFLVALVGSLSGIDAGLTGSGGEVGGAAVSARARAEIPALYLSLYMRAARRYGLDWAVLAGIGKVECDHGRDPAPSCHEQGVVNAAGAGGPAQFLQSTWERYGVSAERQGPPNRWDPADAIFSMANYLRASGAPADYRGAIFAYNHAWWYVEAVLRWARVYGGAAVEGGAPVEGGARVEGGPPAGEGPESTGPDLALVRESAAPVVFTDGDRARLYPGDGHVATIPIGVPAVVQALVAAGNELQDLPYGPDGHPDPLAAPDEDCSSTVNFVLYRAGIRPLAELLGENPLAQSYTHWGAPGPGRWVTIYATVSPTPHVFIVIAGLRLDTSYAGTDTGPNRHEGGPRWRILDHIPAWAHWSVRHPPGL
jgi:hypothetical protein